MDKEREREDQHSPKIWSIGEKEFLIISTPHKDFQSSILAGEGPHSVTSQTLNILNITTYGVRSCPLARQQRAF